MPRSILNQVKYIHFVGLKGVGLTNLALLAKQRGIKITGSDGPEVFVTDSVLEENGIVWKAGFSAGNIEGKPDLVVTTAAHGGMTNPEVLAAKKKGLKVLTYAQALGLFMKGSYGISVCGVGGKGSTCSILATILTEARFDPSYVIGVTRIQPLGFGAHSGQGKYFVAEADEYVACPLTDRQPKFFYQKPQLIIVTNIEYDHPDVYPNFAATKKAFSTFFNCLPPEGLLVANVDNPGVVEVLKDVKGKVLTYGFGIGSQYRLTDLHFSPGEQMFKLTGIGRIRLHLPGRYNSLNAAASAVAAHQLGVNADTIISGIEDFRGISRRFELVRRVGSIDFYDDYAHHPREIDNLICACRDWFYGRRLVIIFQPHTFSRTRALFAEFAKSLAAADLILVMDIYASAREKTDSSVSSEKLAKKISSSNQKVYYLPKTADVTGFLTKNKRPGDVILTVGAGNIFLARPEIIKSLEK